ncbi:MAG: DUF4234 domain-containing protein [Candidatus Dormibacteraeota bacterium]|nr:DUF4234 domain-containing protein [Candidatus Dormibacteraeota bacterium]
MAQIVTIGGQQFKKRNIIAVWLGLPFITLGIYTYVWWYKINDEARRYLGDPSINPVLSVLAFVPGFILIVPPFISIYRTAGRIRRMQERAGIQERAHPWIAILLAFVFGLYTLYLQLCLNEIWDRYLLSQGALPGALPPAAPPSALTPPGAAPPPAP